mgnify:CR=1 FL=1
MNLGDMVESVFRMAGKHDASQRLNCDRQEIIDKINFAQLDLAMQLPYACNMRREGTLSIASGTTTYALDDLCAYPLDFKCIGVSNDYRLTGINPQRGYIESARFLTQGPDGPLEFLTGPRSTAAVISTELDDAVAEAATSINIEASGLTSAHVGRRVEFQGESGDYRIASISDTNTAVLDRPVRGRMTGRGTTGVGTGYADNTPVRIGPAGCITITPRPAPTSSVTWNYLYVKRPDWMQTGTDIPEIPNQYHEALVSFACAQYLKYLGTLDKAVAYQADYQRSVDKMMKRDQDDVPDRKPVNSTGVNFGFGRGRNYRRWGPFAPGTDFGGRWR